MSTVRFGVTGALLAVLLAGCNEAETEKPATTEKAAPAAVQVEEKAAEVVTKEVPAAPASVEQAIIERVAKSRPDLQLNGLTESAIAGVYEAQIQPGVYVYVSADGGHLIVGDLYQVNDQGQGLVNLNEEKRNTGRADVLNGVAAGEMIVYPAQGEKKSALYVFTDIDCGYCRKFHQEVPELNAQGVEVRYLAFPRAGIRSASHDKLATAWCADNTLEALTRLKNRESLESNVCDNNPIAKQYLLGQQLGVNATPTLVKENGELIRGYRPAADLVRELGI